MRHTSRPANHAAGFSLVELMVAMVVALVLLAGVLQILLSNRESFRFQRDMAGLQENARLASFVLDNVVAHAGYRVELGRNDLFNASSASDHGAQFGNEAVVAGVDGGRDDNDVLRIRFQGEKGHDGCVGPATNVTDATSLEMVDLELYVNDDDTLLCRDYSDGANPIAQPIVENVARFNVVYGRDTDDDGSIETYVNAVSPANADDVLSVQVQLLLRSDERVIPQAATHDYTFSDGGTYNETDRRAYQLIDQVVALRNMIP